RPSTAHELYRLVVERTTTGSRLTCGRVISGTHVNRKLTPLGGSCGLKLARGLRGAVDGNLPGDVDHRGEHLQRHRRNPLQDLLVVPTGLASLLVQVHGRAAVLLEDRLEVAQQRRLTWILGGELSGLC